MPATGTSTRPQALDQDAWLDRRQVADIAGCSIDTIRRDEKEHALPTRTGLGGTVLLRIGDLVAIGRIDAGALDPTVTAAQVAECGQLRKDLARLTAEHAKLQTAHAEMSGRLAQSREHLDTLLAQVDLQRELIDLLRQTTRRIGAEAGR